MRRICSYCEWWEKKTEDETEYEQETCFEKYGWNCEECPYFTTRKDEEGQ